MSSKDFVFGKTGRGLALVLLAVLVAGASGSSPGGGISLDGPRMRLEVEPDPFVLRVVDDSGREMLSTVGPLSSTRVTGQHTSRLVLWWLWNRGFKRPWVKADRVVSSHRIDDGVEFELGGGSGAARFRVRARFLDSGALRVEMEALDPSANRFRLSLKKDSDDRYYGMGERYDAVEHSGSRVRMWSEEGGLGLFTLSRYIPYAPFNPFPRGPDTTYFPVPFFMNPGKGYGFLLDDVRMSVFDFGRKKKDRVVIENWNNRFDFMLFPGDSPLDIIEAQTAYTGRIEVPAPWVFAPMNAVVIGEDRVLEVARLLRKEGIPTTAVWSESWWWRTEWEVNRDLYPDYEGMISRLHAEGFRHLGYYQPYVSTGTAAFREGDARGYFTKNRKGETYVFKLGLDDKAQVDLTNPEAREWWTREFFARSEAMGVDGWMHDFGEHTPPDSVSFDGRSGWEVHNQYNLLWSELGHDFWKDARPDGDHCIYIRGGYTGAQKYVPVMWTGDQNANFERLDGLPSNLPAIMSVGISGHPVGTTDIAGYNCFVNRDSDRELFMRWAELGALLPVMRIHRGQDEYCDHWSFDQDRETLEHYRDYSVLHTSLFPYIYTLVHEAAARGWPVVRHLSLHYPDDPETWRLDYQFLLGDRVLVAPVLERGARTWEVYLPEGEWFHWWTGRSYKGPARQTVPADLGEVPMFVRGGRILPLFDKKIDTLVKEDRADLNGYDDANSSIKVVFCGIGEDAYTLWDGTRIKCRREKDSAGSCEVKKAPVKRDYTFDFR